MGFSNSLKFDFGPYNSIPIIDVDNFPPNTFRTLVTGKTDQILGIELTSNTTNKELNPVTVLGTPWTEADPEGVYRSICGYMLYTVDGFGTRTYTGYNLLWQYHVSSVTYQENPHRLTAAQIILRIVKQHYEDPLDITVICSRTTGLGGLGGVYRIKVVLVGMEIVHNDDTWRGVGLGFVGYDSSGTPNADRYATHCLSDKFFTVNAVENPFEHVDDPNEQDPGGESGEGGGDGGFNRDSDSNPVPGLPEINATDAGFVKLYYVTDEVLHLVAAEVYSSNFFDWLKDFLMKPTDMICGIAIVPFIPSLGVRGTHSFGSFSFSTVLTSISSQYKVINCGSINIEKYYGSCFDYSPYTVLQIFLPFIGMRELDVDEVMGRSISVVYHCDCYTGACVAFITTPINNVDSVIAQYSGNILQQVPFGAGDFSQIVAATLSVATAVTGSIAAGGAAGAALAKEGATAGKIVSGAAAAAGENAPSITSSMSNVMSLKPRIEKASIAAGSSGQMSTLKPYLLRRIPRQSLPANYKALNGYPSNIAGPLSNFSGYAEIETIQLSGVNLTEPEITELLTILRGGVII